MQSFDAHMFHLVEPTGWKLKPDHQKDQSGERPSKCKGKRITEVKSGTVFVQSKPL